jgi:DNA end-binding protein Ku
LNYADEVRSFTDVEVPKVDVKDAELKLAIMLTDQIATDEFHPENYKDEVKERVEGLIRRKIDGQEISESKTEAPKSGVIDLMEALKASLAARSGRKGAAKADAPARDAKPERKPAARADAGEARPRALRAVNGGKKASRG